MKRPLFLFGILIALASIECPASERVSVLSDDFSDGDISNGVSWEALPELNWWNPMYVEKVQGRYWAGSRAYGSFGAGFSDPARPGWFVPVKTDGEPLELSFDLMFPEISGKAVLDFSFLGAEIQMGCRVQSNGGIQIGFRPLRQPGQVAVSTDLSTPAMEPGKPRHLTFLFGGKQGYQVLVDGKKIAQAPPDIAAKIAPLLKDVDKLGFMGAAEAVDPDVYLHVPALQGATASFWIGNIQVNGEPSQAPGVPMEPIRLQKPRVLVLGGLASMECAEAIAALKTRFDCQVMSVNQPMSGAPLVKMREMLAPDSLKGFSHLVLLDVEARFLGWKACEQIHEFIKAGGNLIVLGGATTLNRGRFFSSPLASALPATGQDGDNQITGSSSEGFNYVMTPKNPSFRRSVEGIGVISSRAGKAGRVTLVPEAILGTPKTVSLFQNPGFLGKLVTQD
ncbi:MAG: hypothetical protein NTV93_12400 [Verrucomicrobia bacterium]|nr:hypothetical protein [Verrucomicrobiota bacterium]